MSREGEILGVIATTIGTIAAIKLVEYLKERQDSPVNRYQAAVAAQAAASVVAKPLEDLVSKGWVEAVGDRSNPNVRSYRLADESLATA